MIQLGHLASSSDCQPVICSPIPINNNIGGGRTGLLSTKYWSLITDSLTFCLRCVVSGWSMNQWPMFCQISQWKYCYRKVEVIKAWGGVVVVVGHNLAIFYFRCHDFAFQVLLRDKFDQKIKSDCCFFWVLNVYNGVVLLTVCPHITGSYGWLELLRMRVMAKFLWNHGWQFCHPSLYEYKLVAAVNQACCHVLHTNSKFLLLQVFVEIC